MNGLTVADRLGIMLPMLVVEVFLLAATAFVYHLAVRRKVIGDNLIVAKIFVTFWGVFQFAAIGIVFSVLIAVLSIFQTGQRATFLLYFSVVPFLVMGWVGLLRGAWIFATLKAPPPSDTGDDAAIRSANIPIDSGSGWPLRPSFTYGKHGAS